MAAIFLYLALRGLDWSSFAEVLGRTNYFIVALIIFWSSGSYLLRAVRWRVLLSGQSPLSVSSVFWANMTGYLGNLVLPARAGELVRAVYVARKDAVPVAFALAAGITERVVDLAALVLIGVVSLRADGAVPGSMQEALDFFSLAALAGILFILFLPIIYPMLLRVVSNWGISKSSLGLRMLALLESFVNGLRGISRLQKATPFLIYTLLIWLMDGIGMTSLSLAMGGRLSLAQSFLLIAALGISSAIPATPGYVGVYQFVAVIVLTPLGFSRETSIAYILLVQAINLIVVLVWGGAGLWIGTRSLLDEQQPQTHEGMS